MTRENDHRRIPITGRLAALKEAFDELLNAIDKNPEYVLGLYDHELLALIAWTSADDDEDQVDNKVLHAEAKRRHDEHLQQERRFAAFGDQLDLIADLPPDTPWTEARKILATRLS